MPFGAGFLRSVLCVERCVFLRLWRLLLLGAIWRWLFAFCALRFALRFFALVALCLFALRSYGVVGPVAYCLLPIVL